MIEHKDYRISKILKMWGDKEFTNLIVWQEAYRLMLIIYEMCEGLPDIENFVLKSQISRAVISISTNIAEGYGRFEQRDKLRFYKIANGSLLEVKSLLSVSYGLDYITEYNFEIIVNQTKLVHKLLNALIKASKQNL